MLSLRLKTGCILIQDTHKSPPSPPFFLIIFEKVERFEALKVQLPGPRSSSPFPFPFGGRGKYFILFLL